MKNHFHYFSVVVLVYASGMGITAGQPLIINNPFREAFNSIPLAVRCTSVVVAQVLQGGVAVACPSRLSVHHRRSGEEQSSF